MIDAGSPLGESQSEVNLSDIDFDAVLVSHPHQDHYGLIDNLDPTMPVYIGRLSRSLIGAARMFTGREGLANRFVNIKAWKDFKVGPFKVHTYLVDHSSPEAFAFLIEAKGKRLFYTGDFRAHGRKSKVFDQMIKDPPRDIDALIMEGTMLGRSNEEFPDEKSVEAKIYEVIKKQDAITFLLCSSQNIDRVVGAYRACKRAGKIMVVDAYTAWVLEQMKQVSNHVPEMTWPEVKVYVPKAQYNIIATHRNYFGEFARLIFSREVRIKKEQVHEKSNDILFITRPSQYRTIEPHIKAGPINIIYSMWLGYLDDPRYARQNSKAAAYRTDPRCNFIYAHTSGHATVKDLKLFADAINPKLLVPIHTEKKDEYAKHFEPNQVKVFADGENFQI